MAVNCHHNYVAREAHFGANVLVTRKGAVRAREAIWASFRADGRAFLIVRGKGNPRLVLLLQPRRRPRHVAHRGQAPLHPRRPRAQATRAWSAARTQT